MRRALLAFAVATATASLFAQAATRTAAPPAPVRAVQADLLSQFMVDPRPARARFTQVDERGRSSGTLVVGTQGRLRWEQTLPHELLLVSNGKQTWQVEPDLMQATRLDARVGEGWAAVFGNRQQLERDYTVSQQGRRIVLTPRNADGVKASIEFDASGNPQRAILGAGPGDKRDATTTITFTQWARLPGNTKALFDYQPGKGMDVIGGP